MSKGISYEEQILKNKEDIEDAVNGLDGKVDKIEGKGLSTKDYTTSEKNKLAGIEVGAEVNPYSKTQLDGFFNGKVDKVTGKGLSTEDYTTNEKTKLAELTVINIGDYYTKTEIDSMVGNIEATLDAILGV